MPTDDQIVKKIQRIGIVDPYNPSANDITLILEAYLKNKKLDAETFNNYLGIIPSSLKTIFDGMNQFGQNNQQVSVKTLDLMNKAIEILGSQLNKDLSSEERSQIRNQMIALINEARKETESSRSFLKWIFATGATIAGSLIIGIVYIFMPKKGSRN